jgi:hypothetical protein
LKEIYIKIKRQSINKILKIGDLNMSTFFSQIKGFFSSLRLSPIPPVSNPNHNNASSFSSVPDELIAHVFSFLTNARDGAIFERTCKRIHTVSTLHACRDHITNAYRKLRKPLHAPALELVVAIAKRPFTPEELEERGSREILRTPDEQRKYLSELWDFNRKFDAFYDVFKQQIIQLNIKANSEKFGFSANVADKLIRNHLKTKKIQKLLKKCPLFKFKFENVMQAFRKKVFEDMIAAYVNQPLSDITIESFKNEVDLIADFCFISITDIESHLRLAIKEKHSADALKAAARAGTAKITDFYQELNFIVVEENKIVRSQALHRIID